MVKQQGGISGQKIIMEKEASTENFFNILGIDVPIRGIVGLDLR